MIGGTDWHWGISNIGAHPLLIWLEPWAEEFEVATRSTVTLKIVGPLATDSFVDIEFTEDHLVVWAKGGELIEVYIDQALQDSASTQFPFPETSGVSTKEFLGMAFDKQPAARLGGRKFAAQPSSSVWQRFKRALGR